VIRKQPMGEVDYHHLGREKNPREVIAWQKVITAFVMIRTN